MVGHQHIGVKPTPLCLRRLIELTQVAPVILFAQETGLAVISPLDDVLWNPGQIQTSLTRHDGLLPSYVEPHPRHPSQAPPSAPTLAICQIMSLTPFALFCSDPFCFGWGELNDILQKVIRANRRFGSKNNEALH
jgi:hypothetical protein